MQQLKHHELRRLCDGN